MLAPDTTSTEYQGLSASIVQLRVTMPRLKRLNVDYAVDVQQFFSATLGGAECKHIGALPEWPNLEHLQIKGFFNGDDDQLLMDPEANQELLEVIGNAMPHFPQLSFLEVSIEKKPSLNEYETSSEDDDDDDLYITFSTRTPKSSSSGYPAFEPDEAVLMVQGFKPRQHGVAVWEQVVLDERRTGLAVITPKTSYIGWNRVDYGHREDASRSSMEEVGSSDVWTSDSDDDTDESFEDMDMME